MEKRYEPYGHQAHPGVDRKELHLSATRFPKVLNGLPGITEATRKRVLDKAAELNYHHPVVAHEQQAVPEDQNKLNYDIAFLLPCGYIYRVLLGRSDEKHGAVSGQVPLYHPLCRHFTGI